MNARKYLEPYEADIVNYPFDDALSEKLAIIRRGFHGVQSDYDKVLQQILTKREHKKTLR